MKLNIRKIIFGFMLVNIFLILFNNISKADWAPDEITFDSSAGDFEAPFSGSAFKDKVITFCRAHGYSLKSAWGDITYKALYEKEDDEDDAGSRKIIIGSRLAYAFETASSNYEKQNIIWHLNKTNRDSINNQYGIKFRVLNTGTDTVGMPTALKNAIKYYAAPNDPYVSLDVSNVKVTVENVREKVTDDTYKEVKCYKIAKIDTAFGDMGYPGKVELMVSNLAGNKYYQVYDDNSKTFGSSKELTNSDNHQHHVYIKCNDVSNEDEVKVIIRGTYHNYTGEIAKYKYEKTSADKPDKNVQTMLRLKTDDDEKHPSVSKKVKLTQPRLVTAKYIKKITSANGEELYNVADSWDPNDWETENLKPIVKVNKNVGVTEDGRYELTKQNARNFNITAGDIITYNIRVYNVGNDDADLTDTSLESVNKNGEDIIYKNGYVYDSPDDHLEFVDENINDNKFWEWDSSEGAYRAKATKLKVKGSRPSDVIESYEKSSDNINAWSGVIQIDFKVKGSEQNKFKITNNGLRADRDDQTVKFLKSAITKDKDGNEVTKDFTAPKVEVDTSKKVGASDRVNITNYNAPDLTVMNGDTLIYCMRYYSTGLNKTELNFKATDEFGDGLEFESAETQDGKTLNVQRDGSKLIIPALKETLDGITINGRKVTNIPYYDVYLKFKVNAKVDEDATASNSEKIRIINNNGKKNPVYIPAGFELKGKVFIDNLDASGKVTKDRNAIYDNSDRLVPGVKVELLNEDGSSISGGYYENPGTGEKYPAVVYTDENGEYSFPYLRKSKVTIDKEKGTVDGNVEDLNKYRVKFTYNGQEYENIQYAKDNSNQASYATELNQSSGSSLSRSEFNNKFSEINGSNSERYSVMSEANKSVQVKGYTNKSVYATDEFKIDAYSGKDNNRTVTADTKYKNYLNLGLVKREFDLKLENKLDSMDVSINGVKQQFTNFNGGIIKEELKESDLKMTDINHDVYFQEADYNAIAANGDSPIGNDENKELSVWVNYTITVTNESTDNFIGILKQLDFYCDDRFDQIQVTNPTSKYIYTVGSGDFREKIAIPVEGKELDNSADNGKQEIKISLHLSRATIKKVIEENDVLKTLETVAEIGSYSTKYNGDIFGNGHGVGNPNAGKVDEDSNAGNFDLNKYKIVRKSTDPREILQMFNKEDDCRRSLGIILNVNPEEEGGQRKLTGIVFEDETTHDANANTRFGDGTYTANTKDKGIAGATVHFKDNGEDVKVWDKGEQKWKNSEKVKTNEKGEYTIEGFIPSKSYQIQFTYGDEYTGFYNAQDYKSTIDNTKQNYKPPVEDEGGNSPDGAENYWYSMNQVKNKSVAKDDDTKMDDSVTLTNKKALELEDYKTLGENGKYKNTAKTATFYAPIRQEGNKGTDAEEYTISNMNLGLAERPRSELTINKIIDHINITTSDGRVLIDGSKGTANSTTWFDRYVQPIIDENLIYGSTLQVTFRYFITNTGEVDYKSTGEVTYGENGIVIPESRKYYDLGTVGRGQEEVTSTPNKIIDFADNGIKYNPEGLADPENDSETKNNTYWEPATEIEKNMLDDDTKNYYDSASVVLTTNNISFPSLEPGETYGNDFDQKLYLTLSKVLSTGTDQNGSELQYINTTEILQQTNSVGRRSYHTTKTPSTGQHSNSNYTTQATIDDKGRIIGYEVSNATDRGNGQNILLSEVQNRLKSGDAKINKESNNGNYLVLTIPGDIGNPTEKNAEKTTLYWEPDADEGSIVIIPPFGSKKIIWIIIGTIATITLAGGIYLIKKKVL